MTEFQEGLRGRTECTIDLKGGRSCEVKYRGKPIDVVLAGKRFQIRGVAEDSGIIFLLIDPETFNPKNPQKGFVKLEKGRDNFFGRYYHGDRLTYNEYVSREHLMIRLEKRGEEYIIIISDLNSTNGTTVVLPKVARDIPRVEFPLKPEFRQIFERAGRRNSQEVLRLIQQVEEILRQEELRGRGKLGKDIWETRRSRFGNEYFVDGRVAYLPPRGKAIFVGDTHGDSLSTEAIVKQTQFLEEMKRGNDTYLVFLGDYVDRGSNDVRNLEIVLALKAAYPDNVILMMGNHEEGGGFRPYELPQSLEEHFGKDGGTLHNAYTRLFRRLPNVLVTGNGIVALHGGVPKEEIPNLQALRDNEELFRQIRWNDPNEQIEGFQSSPRSPRGTYEFGRTPFEQFMRRIGGIVMVRGHEYPLQGYKLFFDGRLVTIFSNGSPSSESRYKEVRPKFMMASLTEPIVKIDPKKHIMALR